MFFMKNFELFRPFTPKFFHKKFLEAETIMSQAVNFEKLSCSSIIHVKFERLLLFVLADFEYPALKILLSIYNKSTTAFRLLNAISLSQKTLPLILLPELVANLNFDFSLQSVFLSKLSFSQMNSLHNIRVIPLVEFSLYGRPLLCTVVFVYYEGVSKKTFFNLTLPHTPEDLVLRVVVGASYQILWKIYHYYLPHKSLELGSRSTLHHRPVILQSSIYFASKMKHAF